MPPIPCLKAENRCSPCAGDSSNPFANLTIEPEDRNIWLSVYFGTHVNVTPNTWETLACVGFCESSISQTDADDCARRRALECLHDPPLDPIPPEPPPLPPPQVPAICNQEMTCQNGAECYTIPACTIFASSQAEANALAQSLCNERVHNSELSSPCTGGEGGGSSGDEEIPGVLCGAESGSAAPDSLETTAEVIWIDTETISIPPWVVGGGNATLNTFDLPPGEYKIHNLDGYFDEPTGGVCPVGNATRIFYPSLKDTEGTIVNQNNCSTGPFCPAPSEEDGMRANCEFDVNFLPGGQRLNGTGACYLEAAPAEIITGGSGYTVGQPHVISLNQVTGLIPQPRKLQIRNYSQLAFADSVGASNWNGAFNTRDEYIAADLRWDAPSSGFFGGARLQYTMAHPTSANGKGWQIDIYSAGMILMWRGFKAFGNTSIGRYYRDNTTTPVGPACVVCLDASDDVWYPGATPP